MIFSKNDLANECSKLTTGDLVTLHDTANGLTWDVFTLAPSHVPSGGQADTGSIIETLNAIDSVSIAANYRHKINQVSSTISVGDRTNFHRPIQ